ncbi:hypothetical protein [Marinicella rhabdoformis]|uniref:hypothetical protein n=1 Tax=Marinicella rhabdoformis TaxID=2580566 RepID=UPI0012AEBFBE|nr:hypothetical protein [Marinicella rhabdoformis]
MKKISYIPHIVALCLIIAFTAALYYPALAGAFIFDDYHSLSFLKYINGDVNLDNVLNFISFADTGPLKRPISVLSFLIDGNNWPTDPFPFKRTNLIIHIFNAVLLYFIILVILNQSSLGTKQTAIITIFSVAFWVLHPYLLSTSMYVVQRMAMLSATFVFLGVLTFLLLRKKAEISPHNRTYNLIAVVFLGCTMLSVLSKENGILLLLLIPLLEKQVVQNYWGFSQLPKTWRLLLFWLPVTTFVFIFILQIPGYMSGYADREFTLYERLISQPRAIVNYLHHYVTPYYLTEGIYTDGFIKSTGLFKPVTTIISVCSIVAMFLLAFVKRAKWPIFSFSVFFFFVSHLLESTIFPLELYFEHRNYLAFAFLALPMVSFLFNKWSTIGTVILSVVLLFTSFQTFLRASLWGNDFLMHKETVLAFPESNRARVWTSNYYSSWGDYNSAEKVLKEGLSNNDNMELKLNLLLISCQKHQFSNEEYNALNAMLRKERLIRKDLKVLGMIIGQILNAQCGLSLHSEKLYQVLNSFKYSVENNNSKGQLLLGLSFGRYYFKQESFDVASEYFLKAFALGMDYENMIKTVSEFLVVGRPDLALNLIKLGKDRYTEEFKYKIDWKRHKEELLYFERIAYEDLEEKK